MWCGVVSFQCSFILLLMVCSYTNDSIPINTNIEQCMCMRASGASELRNFGIFTFLNCYFFQYFVVTFTGKSLVYHGWILFGGGGAIKRPPPKPPHQYASALDVNLSHITFGHFGPFSNNFLLTIASTNYKHLQNLNLPAGRYFPSSFGKIQNLSVLDIVIVHSV